MGQYRLCKLIGSGGMGAVYAAQQASPKRTVALKLMLPGLATPDLLRRFEYEAQLLGLLEHPGIARVYEAGAAPGPMGMPLMRLERLTFRFVEAGFVVLTLALVLGVVTSPQWRWDHKTVFSLLGWTVFAALLLGRQWRGWRGRRATRWLYAGAVLLLLASVGSRFVFEVLINRGVA